MSQESKEIDPEASREVVTEVTDVKTSGNLEEIKASREDVDDADATAVGSATKKKKSKKDKIKQALGADKEQEGSDAAFGGSSKGSKGLTNGMVEQLMEMNPALKSEVAGMNKEQAAAKVKKMDVAELLTGLVS